MRHFLLSTLFFLLACTFLQAQSILKQPIDLEIKNQALSEVLNTINRTYNIQFSYSKNFVELERKVSVNVQNKSLRKVLRQIFKGSNIQYKVLGNQVVLRRSKESTAPQLSKSKTNPKPILKLYQTVRGKIVDGDTQIPLIGASISLIGSDPYIGTATDTEGQFLLPKVPVGRQSFEVSYLGYETYRLSNIAVISGKELVLPIALKESATALQEVVVNAKIDKMQPLNEMAMVSTRPFSVEETSRYAASFMDPARMAKSFAGVSSRDDLANQIIIRGNAPTNLLWRLEGIEIPNPNHYGQIGSSGGAISMLSISTLSNSDFLTGAFPAEYGNTVSGVFDLRLRNGNHEKRESSFMIGTLGIEVSTEGPLKKGKPASYLFNYRYSTLDVLDRLGFNPVEEGSVPRYQDFSFKFNIPTQKAGKFTIFGLGGYNYDELAQRDVHPDPFLKNYDEAEGIGLGIVGLSHFKLLSDKTYLKSISVASIETLRFKFERFRGDPADNDVWYLDRERYNTFDWRTSIMLNHKFNAKHQFRTGLIYNTTFYDLTFYDEYFTNNPGRYYFLMDKGQTFSLQTYAQWKYRFNENLTAISGIHFLYFDLNKDYSLEPRLALQYQFKGRHQVDFGFGLHSYINHVSTYLFRNPWQINPENQPFSNAQLPRAMHLILGYNLRISEHLRFKTEAYFQHLYNIPVSNSENDSWLSILNIEDNYDAVNLLNGAIVNTGKGKNYGLEFTLEKFLSEGFYFLSTLSLYRSKFSDHKGQFYSTQFDGNIVTNVLLGKEYSIGKNNLIGLNARFIYAGGNRFSPIDLEASIANQATVFASGQVNGEKTDDYSRIDLSVKYAINRPKVTHEFLVEVQNLLDHRNEQGVSFDRLNSRILTNLQTGIIPNINYRLSF